MQPLIPQPDVKRRHVLSTRLENSYAETVERLLVHHGGLQFSKYLRGLIYADATRCGVSTADLDRPAWVTETYPERGQTAQLARQIAALSEQISQIQKAVASKFIPIDRKPLLARKEAAALLSMSLSTIDQLIVRGELKVRRYGKRLLVPRKELERLAARDVPALWPSKQKP